jgi:hypothetical protein
LGLRQYENCDKSQYRRIIILKQIREEEKKTERENGDKRNDDDLMGRRPLGIFICPALSIFNKSINSIKLVSSCAQFKLLNKIDFIVGLC